MLQLPSLELFYYASVIERSTQLEEEMCLREGLNPLATLYPMGINVLGVGIAELHNDYGLISVQQSKITRSTDVCKWWTLASL